MFSPVFLPIPMIPFITGIACLHYMEPVTELERRELLFDHSQKQLKEALSSKSYDPVEASRLLKNITRLMVSLTQAYELQTPGLITQFIKQQECLDTWAQFGITDVKIIEAIYRGQIDLWQES